MINNYELLILNYIFNALHDFNSHHSINIGTLGLINLKRNRKVPIKGAGWELSGVYSSQLLFSLGGRRGLEKWGQHGGEGDSGLVHIHVQAGWDSEAN